MAAPPKAPPPPEEAHYWELEAELQPEAEEVWSLFCFERGAAGSQQTDAPGPPHVRHFFDGAAPPPAAEWLAEFRAAYPSVPPPRRLTLHQRVVENWQDNWRAFFRPTPVGRRLLVCPPWEAPAGGAPRERLPLLIEPGQGFGTGSHPTTALAMELIEAVCAATPAPAAMVDVGAGSGILSVAARLLGVERIIALDIDSRAPPEVISNFRLNGLPAPPVAVGGPQCLRAEFPLVAANLTGPILLELREALPALCAPGGTLIASGILTREAGEVAAAYTARGFTLDATTEREGWAAFRLHRHLGAPHGHRHF